MINLKKKDELKKLFAEIGRTGYFSLGVEIFQKELEERIKEDKEIEIWLKEKISSFLKKVHPGKIYALVGALAILSISDEIVNLAGEKIGKIFKKELKKFKEDPYYKLDPEAIDLVLGCLGFFSGFLNRLNKKNQNSFFETCQELKNFGEEFELIKKIGREIEEGIESFKP